MATVKFQKESPYKQAPRKADETDYKHHQHLHNSESFSLSKDEQHRGPLRVAIFGAGRAGMIHFKNILCNPELHLKYLVESDVEKSERIKRSNNLTSLTLVTPDNIEIILEDQTLNGVIIATPTSTHEELVIKCLESGKAVLCEKPIGIDQQGTKRCYEIAKKAGRPLLCAFNRRFDPSFQEIYKKVRSGVIGRVHMIKTVARDSPLPPISYLKISGGIFHDCAVHDIDLICNILGEYPTKVFAAASAFIPEIKDLNDSDTVAIILKFPSGTIGTIDLSRNSVYGYDQRLEVFGSEGMLEAKNETPIQTSFSGINNVSSPPICHSFPSRYFEAYNQELNHFCDLIRGHGNMEVTAENTLKISKIATALENSLKTEGFVTISY